MTESGLPRLQQLFLDALELPRGERDAWLAAQCGDDDALLAEVRSLLAHDDPSHDPLEKDVREALAEFPSTATGSGQEESAVETDQPMPIDSNVFLANLSRVGVLSPEELQELSASVAGGEGTDDPRELAARLVSDGRLTRYQAAALLRGRPELLLDKYLILDLIGAGGMGMVFKAIHRPMNRIVAVKMISQKLLDSPEQVKRFQREVRAAATLEHPHIVRAYDADQANGVNFLVLEYVRGETLGETVGRQGPLSLEEAVDAVLQAARGLSHAHERGIVHRDVKPDNLIRNDTGTVKVLDLGLANVDESFRLARQSFDAASAEDRRDRESGSDLTQAGAVLGTVSYMAPEQSLNADAADARSDVYGLGCTLYYLLTGEPPYTGETVFDVFARHREAEIPSTRSIRPDVPPAVDAVGRRMLAKSPDDRYQSMDELIAALEACGIAAPPKDGSRPTAKGSAATANGSRSHGSRSPRSSVRTAAAGLGVLGLVALLAYAGSRFWSSPPPDADPDDPAETVPAASGPHRPSRTESGVAGREPTSAADLLAGGEWEWSEPENLGPVVNSEAMEFDADLSEDGCTIVVVRSAEAGGHGNHDLFWIATRESTDEEWSEPKNLGPGINTVKFENAPQLSPTGDVLTFDRGGAIFVTTRTKGTAEWSEPEILHRRLEGQPGFLKTRNGLAAVFSSGHDLSLVERRSTDDPWGEPVPFGDAINTPAIERAGMLSDDRRTLVFARYDGEQYHTGDLWMAHRRTADGAWSRPAKLGFCEPHANEGPLRLSGDGRRIVFSALRPEGHGRGDVYVSRLVRRDRPQTATEPSPADLLAGGEWEWRIVEHLPEPVNSPGHEFGGDMTADRLTIVFSSSRTEVSVEKADLWQATRPAVDAPWTTPVKLGDVVNEVEETPCFPHLSRDGLRLDYFLFGRGGRVTTRDSAASPWSEPRRPEPNAWSPLATTPNGRFATFSRYTEDDGKDLYIVRRSPAGRYWSKPRRLPPPVNTEHHEENAVLSSDGRLLIFDRTKRDGRIRFSMWMTIREDPDSAWNEPQPITALNLGTTTRAPRLVGDEKSLLFASDHPGSLGRTDLYLARLVRKDAPTRPIKNLDQ